MTTDFRKKTSILLNKTLEGKDEKILILECEKCSEWNKDIEHNSTCLYCFLENLFNNKDIKFKKISLESNKIDFEYNKLKPLLEYFEKVNIIKKNWYKVLKILKQGYKKKIFNPKKLNHIISFLEIENFKFLNPILTYEKVLELRELIRNDFFIIDYTELNILFDRLFEDLISIFQNLDIMKYYFEINKNGQLKNPSIHKILGILSLKSNNINYKSIKRRHPNKERYYLIDQYALGSHKIFQARIYNIKDEFEKFYELYPFYKETENEKYILRIINSIIDEINPLEIKEFMSFEDLMKNYYTEIKVKLKSKYNFSDSIINKIASYSAIKKTNFEKLFPLLIDNNIEEIFLDAPDDFIYINHLKHGRCRTLIKLTNIEIERVKTFLRLYSGNRLDYSNPSIKYVIKNAYYYCRFAIDIEPINIKRFSMDIRKLNKNIFTIQDLLKNKTLSPLMAAYLFFAIIRRINITVTGETDTGKTTLINSFDLLTPKEFRKIYVENVIESLNQSQFNKHQLKYKVDSIEELIELKYSKSNQIKKLLHRTPDIIYLGEILTKEEAEAMFHCLSAGLRGFQTIHSNDIPSLINRFLYHFKINNTCLKDLDLIILMKKINNKRKIISVTEISKDLDDNHRSYIDIFSYQPKFDDWEKKVFLYETNCIQKLCLFENLPEKKFYEIMELYTNIFNFMMQCEKIKNQELVSFFHELSYYSKFKSEKLKDFWEKNKQKFL